MKKTIYYLLLCCTVGLLFSCVEDDGINEPEASEKFHNGYQRSIVSFEDMRSKLSSTNGHALSLFSTVSNKGGDAYIQEIDTTYIIQYSNDTLATYTMRVRTLDEENYSYSNLIIRSLSGETEEFIAHYLPTAEWQTAHNNAENTPYEGEVIMTDTQGRQALGDTINCTFSLEPIYDPDGCSCGGGTIIGYSLVLTCNSVPGLGGGGGNGGTGVDPDLPTYPVGGGGSGSGGGGSTSAYENDFFRNLSQAQQNYLYSNQEIVTQIYNYLQTYGQPDNENGWYDNYQAVQFAFWAVEYLMSSSTYTAYFKQHPQDLDILFGLGTENMEYNSAFANVYSDLLIARKNNTLSQLENNWPNLNELKQKIRDAITVGIYTTAKITRDKLIVPLKKYAQKYDQDFYWTNRLIIDPVRIHAVTPMVNFNPDTMGWGDLFNIWLFELSPGHFPNHTISFTNNSNVVNGNNLYNPSTNAVKNFPKGNYINTNIPFITQLTSGLQSNIYNVGSVVDGYFTYDVNAFYNTTSNANLGIQMLGSFPIKATVLTKNNGAANVRFNIDNTLGWESATRFIKGENGNEGIFNNKPVGEGIHLGGNLINTYRWTEIINY